MTLLEAVLPGEEWVTLTSALLHAPFYFDVSFSLIKYLFHDNRVTTDELSPSRRPSGRGLGVRLRLHGRGDHLAGLDRAARRRDQSAFDLLFFSFTNLTSVGLSDILPTGDHAGRS